MYAAYGIALALSLAAANLTSGEESVHQLHGARVAPQDEASIRITINPEARVSAAMAGDLPPPAACGTTVELRVSIINQGFVTAPLEARWAGDAPAGASLTFSADALRGTPQEVRTLRITLSHRGLTDLSVSFKARGDVPDIGGRDRVHFLMRCT